MKNKAYKIRIYPNKSQEKQISQTIGCCRFVFNQMLAQRKEVYDKLKDNKEALKSYQYKTEKELKAEFPFLAEASSRALQQSRINLETAYQNFFAKRTSICFRRRVISYFLNKHIFEHSTLYILLFSELIIFLRFQILVFQSSKRKRKVRKAIVNHKLMIGLRFEIRKSNS